MKFRWIALCVVIAITSREMLSRQSPVADTMILPLQSAQTASSPYMSAEQMKAATEVAKKATSEREGAGGVWQYSETADAMRGTATKFALLQSATTLQFSFPYQGGSTAELKLQKDAKRSDVVLSVSKGQFICYSFNDDKVTVKFDNGPVQEFSCGNAADGSHDLIFIQPAAKFISALKRSKALIIEAPFYQAGNRQMHFSTAGLKW